MRSDSSAYVVCCRCLAKETHLLSWLGEGLVVRLFGVTLENAAFLKISLHCKREGMREYRSVRVAKLPERKSCLIR